MSIDPRVVIPKRVLRTLLVAQAASAAHYNLCGSAGNSVMVSHPGDPFGRTLGWLWTAGLHDECVQLVVDYLAEMRQHNPNAPQPGDRLTWESLQFGLRQALDPQVSPEETEALLEYLREQVPRLYGAAPKRLNEM